MTRVYGGGLALAATDPDPWPRPREQQHRHCHGHVKTALLMAVRQAEFYACDTLLGDAFLGQGSDATSGNLVTNLFWKQR
ncbi:unnamed protein product [Urochloa humidicola]